MVCKALFLPFMSSTHIVAIHKSLSTQDYMTKVHSIYVLFSVADLEELFGRLWTQCQECQGSLHQDVLCTRLDIGFNVSSNAILVL